MTTYKEAEEYLGTKKDRPIEYATRVQRRDDGSIVIRQHSTDIVTYMKDGTIVLTSGGWKTPTTKDRLNRYSGIRLYQSKGVWYIDEMDEKYNHKTIGVFADGMKILPDGTYEGYETYSKDDERKDRKTRQRVLAYCRAFFDELSHGNVPSPSLGDCWFCVMKTKGEALGDVQHDASHLLAHIEERYYVASLLENAIRRYRVCDFARQYVTACWIANDGTHPHYVEAKEFRGREYVRNIARRDVVQSMYRYINGQLGFAGSLLRGSATR